ncbi:MAG: ABC transporter substrate-binding protein [candidate division WOR-3 bacterium]
MRRLLVGICLLTGTLVLAIGCAGKTETPVLKVGHVGHDHHSALYVACLAGQDFQKPYNIWFEEVKPKELYKLHDGKKVVCEVELYKAGGGSDMPTAMSQGTFDVGFGGVAAVEFFVDKGSPLKLISPLHSKGDMLVMKPDLGLDSWQKFIEWVKAQKKQVRIGFKNPVAVAELIFKRALQEEGITFTTDAGDTKAKILMVMMKEEANLNTGLQTGQIDGYVSNNPWAAIAESKGIGKCVAELHDLPPGVFRDHPCCCIAANNAAVAKQGKEIQKFLELMAVATHYINTRREEAAALVAKWIGTTPEVEMVSMATSGYSMEPDKAFYDGMWVWYEEMVKAGKITGTLKDKTRDEFEKLSYDFSLLKPALAAAQKRLPKQ